MTSPYRQNTAVVRQEWPRTSFWRLLRAWLPGGYWWRDRRPVCVECGRRGCEQTEQEAIARAAGGYLLMCREVASGRLLVKAGDKRGPEHDFLVARYKLRNATRRVLRLPGVRIIPDTPEPDVSAK